ncbi:MAG: carboxypeptidase-like regulatory domain-containing protein [Patescibacteria group bacterium]
MMDFVSPAYGTKPLNIKRVVVGLSVIIGVIIISFGSLWYVKTQKQRVAVEAARPKAIVAGTVVDQHQRIVSDVQLEVINSTGDSVAKTNSLANGTYQFVLNPGFYRLVAISGEFQTSKQIYLVQNSNEKADIKVILP